MLVGLSLNKQPVAEQLADRPPPQQALVHTATMWLCDLCGAETMDQVQPLANPTTAHARAGRLLRSV